jgi:hypothetical protein
MRLRRTRPKQIRKCNGEPVLLMTVLDADSERGRRIRNEEAVVTPRFVCPIAATLPFEWCQASHGHTAHAAGGLTFGTKA